MLMSTVIEMRVQFGIIPTHQKAAENRAGYVAF
jgi:hypothetical protein